MSGWLPTFLATSSGCIPTEVVIGLITSCSVVRIVVPTRDDVILGILHERVTLQAGEQFLLLSLLDLVDGYLHVVSSDSLAEA
jgi:hypothetical protein